MGRVTIFAEKGEKVTHPGHEAGTHQVGRVPIFAEKGEKVTHPGHETGTHQVSF